MAWAFLSGSVLLLMDGLSDAAPLETFDGESGSSCQGWCISCGHIQFINKMNVLVVTINWCFCRRRGERHWMPIIH